MLTGQTVIILRRTGRDKFGDTEFDAHHEEHNVLLSPSGTRTKTSSAAIDFRDTIVDDVTAYFGPGADVLASDQAELPGGGVYAVEGKPQRWKAATPGGRAGVVATLRQVSG
ncbi:hypothetical protein [Nocardia terpenica]|uniref:Head-to-tail stopper n=1 Tax=Nocardia terpenica TaxID=455432 RepID=A0A164K5S1_9NOCA|nr:hypothetical protein [Nocardia terpenica]KZM71064.1 hypothetical protein AWN90_41855 [Nocardia terpenica]NQE89615.1 hypothetical protein [Nocardia terpenica]